MCIRDRPSNLHSEHVLKLKVFGICTTLVQEETFIFFNSNTLFSTDCVILQHPVIGSESSQILMINNSFSSQTWTILVPNRNSDQKSIYNLTNSPKIRCKKWGYQQYLVKMKEKNLHFFQNIFIKSLILREQALDT